MCTCAASTHPQTHARLHTHTWSSERAYVISNSIPLSSASVESKPSVLKDFFPSPQNKTEKENTPAPYQDQAYTF
jgi:hypothetical protein